MTCLPFFDYFVFLDGLCANALPAAVLDFALVRPSRKTSDAAEAALAEVSLLFCIFQSRPSRCFRRYAPLKSCRCRYRPCRLLHTVRAKPHRPRESTSRNLGQIAHFNVSSSFQLNQNANKKNKRRRV